MATFSELEITFSQEFEPTASFIGMFVNYTGAPTGLLFETIVTTRANAYEFSTGTDAVTQAQFYKDALDLDWLPSGDWEFTIVGATVTIKSTREAVNFTSVTSGAPNDERFTFVINNFSNEIAPTSGVLLARSNFYLSLPITTEQFIDLDMFFRSGDLTLPLTTSDYEKRVQKPSLNWLFFDVLFSRFALDFLEPKPIYQSTTGILNSAVGSLVATTVRTKSDTSTVWQERYKDLITTRGYSNYAQGVNYLETTASILLTSAINQVLKDDVLVIPFINSATPITVKDDLGNLLFTFSPITDDLAESKIQYAFFDTTGIDSTYFLINDTYYFEVVTECKYTPQGILFLNKFGVFENFTFFKAKQDSVEFTQEGKYKNNFVLGGQYDTSRHLYRSGNKNGRDTLTLNSGYINEAQNEAVKGMLNSEYVYFNNAGTFIPVNIDTTSLRILTGLNDNLISYAVDFKYSYDLVQNV